MVSTKIAWLIYSLSLIAAFVSSFFVRGSHLDMIFFVIANMWLVAIYLKSKEGEMGDESKDTTRPD